MKIKALVLLIPLIFAACELDSGRLLPTKNEIIKAAEKAGATDVVISSYVYANDSWDNPSIKTDGGYNSTKENYITNIEIRVVYTVPQGSSVSHTTIGTAIRQLFVNNGFSSDEITVFANPTNLPSSPEETETYPLPAHQVITETVQIFGATSVTVATYTANGKNVSAAGSTAPGNAFVVIRVNYTYDGLGTVIPSQAAVTLALRDLFTDFQNLTVSVIPSVEYPLPSHAGVLAAASGQGAKNAKILAYTAGNEIIGEFYYGGKSSNTKVTVSLTYDVGANVTLIEQAIRGLFQHFTSVTITTMLSPPTHEDIINALYNEGAESVNIIAYTISGSNDIEGVRSVNAAVYLEVNYTTSSTSSNGQTAVRNLFTGFTNSDIFVGNNIPINLPTETEIANILHGTDYEIAKANINLFTVNGIDATTMNAASSSDEIIIRIQAFSWVTIGFDYWGQGYYQAIGNNSVITNNAKGRVKQLFIDKGFSHANNISIIFE